MMKRFPRFALALALASAVPRLFGGWAIVVVEDLPDYAVVGQPMTLTFTVRAHGLRSLPGLRPRVDALGGSELKTYDVASSRSRFGPMFGPYRYRTTITFPRAGDWIITIHSGYADGRTTLMPLKAVAPGPPVPRPLSEAERGRRLFAAKGCFTCHVERRVGPDLYQKRYAREYVSRVLADPARVFPARQGAFRMPDLNLKPFEISALAAYLSANDGTAP